MLLLLLQLLLILLLLLLLLLLLVILLLLMLLLLLLLWTLLLSECDCSSSCFLSSSMCKFCKLGSRAKNRVSSDRVRYLLSIA